MGEPFELSGSWSSGSTYRSILDGEPRYKSIFGDQFQLKIDPELEARFSYLQWRLQIDQVRSSWLNPDWSILESLLSGMPLQLGSPSPGASSPSTVPAAPPPAPTSPCFVFPQGKGPDTPKSGEVSDVLKAVWALPVVKCTLDKVTTELETNVWDRLNAGEKALLIVHGGMIVGGTVAGIISDKPARTWVFDKLSNTDIPIPKLDGVSFKFYAKDGAITGGSFTMPWLPGTSVTTGAKPVELPDKSTVMDYHFQIKVDVLTAIPQLKAIF